MASAVMVALDRRFSGLTPRTGRDNCGFGNCSGRGARRFSGLARSHGRMPSAVTGGGKLQVNLNIHVIPKQFGNRTTRLRNR